MEINIVGAFIRNAPFGTEIAFSKGFKRIGVKVNEIDPDYENQIWNYNSDFTLIFKWLEGPYLEDLKKCKGFKIVYQPDDYRFPHIKEMMKKMREYCDYALTYDLDAAVMVKKDLGYLDSDELLLTADNELYKPLPNIVKDIDFSFIGSLSGVNHNHKSRNHMIDIMRKNGFNVYTHGFLYDINKIVEIYNRSKVVLNHATDIGQSFGTGWGYQCRHFEVGMTKTCLLSNHVIADAGDLDHFYRFESENSLLRQAANILNNKFYEIYAKSYYKEIMERHLPEHRAKEVLNFVSCL